jgi:ketosteroid isomerase-like protein/mannose-6-phosphate isomerase-like protein (cupin superfamily)
MANSTTNDSASQSAEQRQKIQIFHARDARSMMELGIMSVEFPPEVKPLVAEAVGSGLIAGDEVKVLFSMPGFSLLHAWLKKDYPLAAHSHDADCLYWIVSGALQYGNQTLRKGDGFFVPANVPYAYIPVGDNGVEVLEFRHVEKFNFKARSGERFWQKAIQTCKTNGQSWKDAESPLWRDQIDSGDSQAKWTEVADRFWNALDLGNLEGAVACCHSSTTTWHNFDQKTMTLEESKAGWGGYIAAFDERATIKVRRNFIGDGFFQQHTLKVRLANGAQKAWDACVIMRFKDGLITSIEEYIDRAGAYAPAADSSSS